MPALSGPPPKPRDQIRHRVQPRQDWVDVENVSYPGPYPKLPGEARFWHPQALRFWTSTRRAPIAALWSEDDWHQAIECARVSNLFWVTSKPTYAAELRRRETELGLSWHARRAMRIRYVEPEKPATSDDDDEEHEGGKLVDFVAYRGTI